MGLGPVRNNPSEILFVHNFYVCVLHYIFNFMLKAVTIEIVASDRYSEYSCKTMECSPTAWLDNTGIDICAGKFHEYHTSGW